MNARDHQGCRLEDRRGDLCHQKTVRVGLTPLGDRRAAALHKVIARDRDQFRWHPVTSTYSASSKRRAAVSEETTCTSKAVQPHVQATAARAVQGFVVPHPPRHNEIRLSLSQLCGVNRTPLQLPRTGQCAPHSFAEKGFSLVRGHRIEADMMPPTASQKRPAMVSRWLRLKYTGNRSPR